MKLRATRVIALAAGVGAIWTATASAAEVYVTNRGSNDVTAVDTETGSSSTIPLPPGSQPNDIAISPDGTRAYVAGLEDVFVINTETRVVAGTIPVGFPLVGIAVTPDGSRVYVIRQDEPGELFAIDTATNAVVGPAIALGRQSGRLAITPDGARAFVTNTVGAAGEPDLMTVDLLAGTASPTSITEVNSPRGISIKPDGSQVYVVSNSANEVAVIDSATSAIAGPAMNGARGFMAITPDGTTGIGTMNDRVQAFDLISNQPTGPGAEIADSSLDQIAIEPDGSRAWVPAEGIGGAPNRLIAVDTETLATAGGPFPIGSDPRGIAIVPNQPPEPVIDLRIKGRKLTVDARESSDESLAASAVSWEFGDGATAQSLQASHTYRKPKREEVTLTLDDRQGCTGFVFTGQTALCNGPSVVTTTAIVAAIKLGKVKRNAAKGTASLKVKAQGPGKLKLAGKGVRKDSAKVKAGKAGGKLAVRAKGGKLRALERSGAAKLKLKVTFRPEGGEPNTLSKKAKLVRR